ncbi:MurT ligase domain-containing protein [Syntrophomonas curvata]
MNKLRFILAIAIGKILILFSRWIGNQGSNFPGKMARRVYPGILRELAARITGRIIIVTGTNGKTTTSNMLAQIINQTGASLVHNQAGANMIPGITTAFIAATGITGQKQFDYALLETDEANVPLLLKEVKAGLILITNFFRDQLDRYGELDYTVQVIREAVKGRGIDLILNADDPLSAHFQGLTAVHCWYYGFAPGSYDSYESRESREGRYCVICGQELQYQRYHYAQLGKYSCPGCGNHNPSPDFTGHGLVMHPAIELMVDDMLLSSPYQGFYNAYNIVAAVSAARLLGIEPRYIQKAIADFKPRAGRMESFTVNGRPNILILVKNPTGLNQSLAAVMENPAVKHLFFALNDQVADGRDISWIWDADIEAIETDRKIKQIVCSGIRSGDIALRMKYAGYPADQLIIKSNLKEGIEYVTSLEGDVSYILSTYTALFECRKILLSLQKRSGAPAGKVPVRG